MRVRREPPKPKPKDKADGGKPPRRLRYPHPKILLVDMPKNAAEQMAREGYAATAGTFGRPYIVPSGPGYLPVIAGARLPGYAEQEIIVVDLAPPETVDTPDGEPPTTLSESLYWTKQEAGVVDPRPKIMRQVADGFDRIYHHGGVFVVFVDPRLDPGYVLASRRDPHSSLNIRNDSPEVDNWSFLQLLQKHVQVEVDQGREIEIAEDVAASAVGVLLKRHLASAYFTATIHPDYMTSDRWVTFAQNKFGQPVASVIVPEPEGTQGLIFLLPHVADPGQLLLELVKDVLPELTPRLFPHAEGKKWVHRPEYELPEIVALRKEIDEVNRSARERVAEVEKQIEAERERGGWIHSLLTESGDSLAEAVKRAFETLGFVDVVDVDSDPSAKGTSGGDLREDLQVRDRSPLLLVEVKGISGVPREAGSLQVAKYIAPRMRSLDRTDVQGLAIVNHQRSLPPIDRQKNPFQGDVITTAEAQGFGLMTGWDLYRIVRNFLSLGWVHEDVADLFYKVGRIEVVPASYQYVGVTDGFWEQASAVGIRLDGGETLSVGDTVAFELAVDFSIERVTSLQIDDRVVEQASDGDHVGSKTTLPATDVRDGIRVFRVGTHEN